MDAPSSKEHKTELRDYLAAERTLLAWIRTELALTYISLSYRALASLN